MQSNLFTTPADFWTVGAFIEGLGQTLDWVLRARDSGAQMCVLPELTLFRRIHQGNMGRTRPDEKHLYLQSLKDSLDRRRQKAREENAAL